MLLRALEPEDLECLYELENDEETWAYADTSAPYSRYTLNQFIGLNTNDFFADRQLRLVAQEGDDVVGLVDMFAFNPKHQRAEVGIILLRKFRNRGLGSKMLDALNLYVSRHIHLHQLIAYVATENQYAKKAFQNSGYQHTAILKDWICVGGGTFYDADVYQKSF